MKSSHTFPAVSPIELWRHGGRVDRGLVFGGWALTLALSVWLGLEAVIHSWSGLPLRFGGVEVFVTAYPPLVICLWWSLCFGFWWGAIPAYLSTLALSLYAGMDLHWALLFACADPLGFAVYAVGYRAISVSRTLRGINSFLFFLQLSFVASVFGSSGALVWSYTNRIDTTALLAIWQGWWLGFFLQCAVFMGPLLWFSVPPLERWFERHPRYLAPPSDNPRRNVSRMALALVGGVVIYGFLTIHLGAGQVEQALRTAGSGRLAEAAATMVATSWVLFCVFALIVAFIGFFGYQIFALWLDRTERLLADLDRANAELARAAETDMLTGLANRRSIERQFALSWERVCRFDEHFCLIMLDLDHFKHVNDRHGHDAGDLVLQSFSADLRRCVRAIDTVGRWGGEEFVVVLPHTEAEGGARFIERLRAMVAGHTVHRGDTEIRYGFSAGLALSDPADGTRDAWLRRADQALLDAKRLGRGLTILAAQAGTHSLAPPVQS